MQSSAACHCTAAATLHCLPKMGFSSSHSAHPAPSLPAAALPCPIGAEPANAALPATPPQLLHGSDPILLPHNFLCPLSLSCLTCTQVLHGSDHDVTWLQRDFNLYLVNLFDTGQVRVQLCNCVL